MVESKKERKHINVRTQILADIQKDILLNKSAGEKLPSESEYVSYYQVARSTIQKVLKDLESIQMIERMQGKGSFVKNNKPKIDIINYKGFSDYAYEMGAKPVTKQIKKKILYNDSQLYLQRLRGIGIENNMVWLTLDETIIDLEKYPNLANYDFEERSLYEILREHYNSSPTTAQLSSNAVFATELEAKLLEIDKEIPLLKIEGKILDEEGGILEMVKVLYSPNANFKLVVGI